MMPNQVRKPRWSRLNDVIAESMGLHFPRARWDDMQRGLAGATQEFGFDDVTACVDWLLSAPPTKAQLQVLAGHLTIGETYFFRERRTLDALAEDILPALIHARRGGDQRLRIWSAACSSGEEPYSLAILLHRMLPDLRDWRVTINATDINARFLRKAVAGTYGEWSFRDAPAWLKQNYFDRSADGRYTIITEIRKLVNFAHLNLVEDVYPTLATDLSAMDVIVCRNVLMYFTPPQMHKVIGNLRRALVEGGWLVVSPSEASEALFPQFLAVNFPGAILFQKSDALPATEPQDASVPAFTLPAIEALLPWTPAAITADLKPAAPREESAVTNVARGPVGAAKSLYQAGLYGEVVDTLPAESAEGPFEPAVTALLARALANQGRLVDALAWCDRWITADKLNPAAHYLRAVVLLEHAEPKQARASLRRVIYLDQGFVLAHFALGNLARNRGNTGAGNKHFANALYFLRRYKPDDLLLEPDGLTAGQLAQTLASITEREKSP